MAWSVRCLPCNHEDLSLGLQNPWNSQEPWHKSATLILMEKKQADPRNLLVSPSSLLVSSRFSEQLLVKKKKVKGPERWLSH